jgi:hypothetical protein
MNLLPKPPYENSPKWDEEFNHVSSFYGPGAIISWFILAISMLYDANQAFKTQSDWFHVAKYGALGIMAIVALGDATWRGLKADFGPKYAAALYMSDKGVELAVLLYTLSMFPMERRPKQRATAASSQPPDEERPQLA